MEKTHMTPRDTQEVLRLICQEDARFAQNGYLFLSQALDHTVKKLDRAQKKGTQRHVSGQELLEGIREFALEQFGPLTRTVLENWGITKTEDFGAMVFNMVRFKLLGKTDSDKPEDFANGYDFYTAFELPFRPKNKARAL